MATIHASSQQAVESISPRIIAALRSSQMSQTAMAAHLGMGRTALNDRMNGRARFQADELPAIAAMLGVTVADLVGESC